LFPIENGLFFKKIYNCFGWLPAAGGYRPPGSGSKIQRRTYLMNRISKLIALLTALVLVFALAACKKAAPQEQELSEEEKDYDRNTSMETLKLIVKLGYKITKN
jgi:hypothetical protein